MQLAFREFRQNNGLWDKNYTKKQIKDLTEMFFECFAKTPVNYANTVWQAFIEEVGKDREVDKPKLKKGDIVKASCLK